MTKYLTIVAQYALGLAAFGFLCSLIGVDLDVALITVSQAAGQPWLPWISFRSNPSFR